MRLTAPTRGDAPPVTTQRLGRPRRREPVRQRHLARNRTPNVDLELYNGAGTKVAETTSTTAKPETLSYVRPSSGAEPYTVKVLSRDYDTTYSLDAGYPTMGYANVRARLKNGTTTLREVTAATGTIELDANVTAAGSVAKPDGEQV